MWLEVLSGGDAGRVVEVDRPLVLGRVKGAGLVIRDARASRRHAELVPEPGGLRLRDLGSANGTLVDGEPASEVLLRGGEEIRIGGVRIAVLAQEPAVTGAPIPEPVRQRPVTEAGGPSWSLIGRLVDARARRGRRLTYTALAVAAGAIAAVLVLALSGALAGKSDEERVADVVGDIGPATVRIETRSVGSRSGLGSGWVLDRGERLVVTAAHVVNTGQRFFVSSPAGTAEAKVVGVNPCEDLALLRAAGDPGPAAISIDDAAAARQGETVLAFGFPETAETGAPASSTRGVVSAAGIQFPDPAPDVPAYPDAIRTDTALDPGFSGGPLVDLDGRLVGVNAAVRSTSAGERPLQGANYAVAGERARGVLRALRDGRSTAWIGAGFGYPTTAELAGRGLPPGLYVQGVVPGSGAERAGLEDGDYIVAVDGRPLDGTLSGWCRVAGRLRSGQVARLELGAGDRRSVDVRLG